MFFSNNKITEELDKLKKEFEQFEIAKSYIQDHDAQIKNLARRIIDINAEAEVQYIKKIAKDCREQIVRASNDILNKEKRTNVFVLDQTNRLDAKINKLDASIKRIDKKIYQLMLLAKEFATEHDTIPRETLIQIKEERKESEALSSRPINELQFSSRTLNCLINSNIKYLIDLVNKTEDDLLRIKNFGRKSLREVKEILKTFDLQLGMNIGTKTIKKEINGTNEPQ